MSRIKGLDALQTVAARALDNDAYRQELLDDPVAVLERAGVDVPDGVQVVVHVNTSDTINLVLPTGLEDPGALSPDETDVRVLSCTLHF